MKIGFLDWSIIGCYYACYHATHALIITKGYSSKNHLATLCILIKEFYRKGLNKEEIEILSNFLDYQDVLFYVESKNKREDATYSSKIRFTKEEVESLRIKAILFVSKIKEMIKKR
ncbi:HEPN domain-containing protein [Candidatus Woesearchaeota archaeon]|nr:HEPN domain-containing protein [Candidatus Woesearchaeota archaeon]